jgi:hypothetical protein
MQPIERDDLSSVYGGFGALLGTLAQSAGPILNGVASIIGASKSGKSAGGGGAPPAQPPPGGGEMARAIAAPGMPPGPPPSDPGMGSGSGVSISVSINGVPQR